MKHYTVEITNEALADMEQLYNHIAYVLQAPENAVSYTHLDVYKRQGLSCTLTSGAGGVGGKTGLYEVGVPIKENTKQGYKIDVYKRQQI